MENSFSATFLLWSSHDFSSGYGTNKTVKALNLNILIDCFKSFSLNQRAQHCVNYASTVLLVPQPDEKSRELHKRKVLYFSSLIKIFFFSFSLFSYFLIASLHLVPRLASLRLWPTYKCYAIICIEVIRILVTSRS